MNTDTNTNTIVGMVERWGKELERKELEGLWFIFLGMSRRKLGRNELGVESIPWDPPKRDPFQNEEKVEEIEKVVSISSFTLYDW